MTQLLTCKTCGETKRTTLFYQSAGRPADICRACCRTMQAQAQARREASRARQGVAACERERREAALHDDMWAAMYRGRSTRALQAAKPAPQGPHNIRLKRGEGFITIAELACRHAEREACRRAAKTCKTFEAAAAAVAVLELATPGLQRVKDLSRRWHRQPPKQGLEAVMRSASEPEGEPVDDGDDDPFDEAFGDWAPDWVRPSLMAA